MLRKIVRGILELPIPLLTYLLRDIHLLHRLRKNCHFLDPPRPMSLRNTNMVHKYDKAFYELKINLAGLIGLQSVYLDHLKLKHPV